MVFVNRQNLVLGLSGAITAALTLCGHPAKPGNELLLDQMWNTKVSDLKHKSCFFCRDPLQHLCPLLVFDSLCKGWGMHFLRLLTFSHSKSKLKKVAITSGLTFWHSIFCWFSSETIYWIIFCIIMMIVIFILVLKTIYASSFLKGVKHFCE